MKASKKPDKEAAMEAFIGEALIGVDIVLIGQLQDRIMKGPEWAKDLEGMTEGIAAAIEKKLTEFIEERAAGK